jgi:hypothetical protein
MSETKAPAEYTQVTVDLARQIAVQCKKDVIVIMSIDRQFDKTHFTTYGVTADDKLQAACFGETIATGLGCGGPLERFEDFRTVDAATRAADIDRLGRVGQALDHALSSLLVCRTGIADELLEDLQGQLREALKITR